MPPETGTTIPEEVAETERQRRGRLVRETWVDWAREQPDAKPSWLIPWEELDEDQREVDMRIGDAIAAAERERLCAELGNDHWVTFTEDGWTVQHSVECRLSGHMHECAWLAAVRLIAGESGPDMAGRWLITAIDSEGLPVLTRDGRAGEGGDRA